MGTSMQGIKRSSSTRWVAREFVRSLKPDFRWVWSRKLLAVPRPGALSRFSRPEVCKFLVWDGDGGSRPNPYIDFRFMGRARLSIYRSHNGHMHEGQRPRFDGS